ncbi:MAG TPA: hypothetical protein VE996_11720 [Terriglobales bacterium]|nr:hypothetical protein [Terriglobales bacterium]
MATQSSSRFWRWLNQLTCSHHWVRARWADGSYGLRCASCMKPYPVTFDDLMEQQTPRASSPVAVLPPARDPELARGAVVEARPANRPLVA